MRIWPGSTMELSRGETSPAAVNPSPAARAPLRVMPEGCSMTLRLFVAFLRADVGTLVRVAPSQEASPPTSRSLREIHEHCLAGARGLAKMVPHFTKRVREPLGILEMLPVPWVDLAAEAQLAAADRVAQLGELCRRLVPTSSTGIHFSSRTRGSSLTTSRTIDQTWSRVTG